MSTNKIANENLRIGYLNAITTYLEKEDEVLRVKSNEIAIPVVDCNGDEKWVVITVKVPTGANKGTEQYNGYEMAEDYAHKVKEKEIKAKKRAEKDRQQKEKRQKEIELNKKNKG